jgi:hypothetical protein
MKRWMLVIAVAAAVIVTTRFFTIFVVQPIGAVPEGRTVIITRLTNVNFIDSADAICARRMGGVNLLCRGAVIARVLNESTIIARLPYSSLLYGISTSGKTYEK